MAERQEQAHRRIVKGSEAEPFAETLGTFVCGIHDHGMHGYRLAGGRDTFNASASSMRPTPWQPKIAAHVAFVSEPGHQAFTKVRNSVRPRMESSLSSG